MKRSLIKNLLLLIAVACILSGLATVSACEVERVPYKNQTNHIHAFDDYKVTKIPTCTEDGEKEYYCLCGEKRTEALNSLGHNYILHSGRQADCTEFGWEEYRTCSRCNYTEYAEIPSLEHVFGDWEISKQATCSEKGEETRICLHNETHIETRELQPIGHAEGIWEILTYSTCEEEGLKVKVCDSCNEELESEKIPALGHEFGAWIIISEPDCTHGGKEKRVCINDENHVEIRNTAALEHNYKWEYDENEHRKVCELCGDEINNSPHEWSGGICKECGLEQPSAPELNFESYDGISYVVTGIGAINQNELVIPSNYKGLPVKAIAPNAFRDCTFITSVTVSKGVTVIGDGAFFGCINLLSVNLSDTVEYIGSRAFSLCSKLKNLVIPRSVKVMGEYALSECEELAEVTFENCEGWNIYENNVLLGDINQEYLEDPILCLLTLNIYQEYKWICG